MPCLRVSLVKPDMSVTSTACGSSSTTSFTAAPVGVLRMVCCEFSVVGERSMAFDDELAGVDVAAVLDGVPGKVPAAV